jgi:2-polyprenyl-3-methyl-5-hydroxy-6-metoxy-1,4-benzoquinol methylase
MSISTTVFHRSEHLAENDLVPVATGEGATCPFCAGTACHPVWTLQDRPVITLLSCSNCHGISASRMPTDEALSRYYGSYYQDDASAEQITFDRPDRLAQRIAAHYIPSGNGAQISILDFGGGDGTVANLVGAALLKTSEAEITIDIVDYAEKTVEPTHPNIHLTHKSSIDEVAARYDIVIASAVIEHHPMAGELLSRLLDHVQEETGLFYARTPSMLPLMRLVAKTGFQLDFTYPGHLHDLGQRFWETYLSRRRDEFQLLESTPSIPETTFRAHFLRAFAARVFKAPWHLLGRRYGCVGGWQVFVRRHRSVH